MPLTWWISLGRIFLCKTLFACRIAFKNASLTVFGVYFSFQMKQGKNNLMYTMWPQVCGQPLLIYRFGYFSYTDYQQVHKIKQRATQSPSLHKHLPKSVTLNAGSHQQNGLLYKIAAKEIWWKKLVFKYTSKQQLLGFKHFKAFKHIRIKVLCLN